MGKCSFQPKDMTKKNPNELSNFFKYLVREEIGKQSLKY